VIELAMDVIARTKAAWYRSAYPKEPDAGRGGIGWGTVIAVSAVLWCIFGAGWAWVIADRVTEPTAAEIHADQTLRETNAQLYEMRSRVEEAAHRALREQP
jgi:hypothetical protein